MRENNGRITAHSSSIQKKLSMEWNGNKGRGLVSINLPTINQNTPSFPTSTPTESGTTNTYRKSSTPHRSSFTRSRLLSPPPPPFSLLIFPLFFPASSQLYLHYSLCLKTPYYDFLLLLLLLVHPLPSNNNLHERNKTGQCKPRQHNIPHGADTLKSE